MAARRRSALGAVVAGIATLAGVLGTVAAADGTAAALVVLVFLMFCGTVVTLSALVVHLADRVDGLGRARRRAVRRRARPGRPQITTSARTKREKR